MALTITQALGKNLGFQMNCYVQRLHALNGDENEYTCDRS
jgi:hypothetical protein